MMPTSPSSRVRLTPSDTTRSASTSRPESVSSRMAMRGLSRRICRISWRFFSPPEKPSLTLRSANAWSISSADISLLTSLTQVRSFGASPVTAVAAVRRKFDTETPGTSTGYCIARNRPARARSSTLMASTSSPSSVTLPEVIVYFGWPAIEYARVDLPDTCLLSLSVADRRVDVDEHVVAVHADRVDGHRLGGRQVGGAAAGQVETR